MYCLGKLPKRYDPRNLKLRDFLSPGVLPAPPLARDWFAGLPTNTGDLGNDSVGNCTTAAAGHQLQAWTQQATGTPLAVTTQQAIAAYSAVTGYTSTSPTSDRGAVIADVLDYWQSTGIAGHKIGAYLEVDHTDQNAVETAINLFGGVITGIELPVAAKQQIGGVWTGAASPTGDAAPSSWGGHCAAFAKYDYTGPTCITWGLQQEADWLWWQQYVDECWAIVSLDWLETDGAAPNGFNVAALNAALAAIRQG